MQTIGSSSNNVWLVYVNGVEKPLKIASSKAEALGTYLTSSDVSMFVEINDMDGNRRYIKTSMIQRVEESKEKRHYKSTVELNMPDLSNRNSKTISPERLAELRANIGVHKRKRL